MGTPAQKILKARAEKQLTSSMLVDVKNHCDLMTAFLMELTKNVHLDDFQDPNLREWVAGRREFLHTNNNA